MIKKSSKQESDNGKTKKYSNQTRKITNTVNHKDVLHMG